MVYNEEDLRKFFIHNKYTSKYTKILNYFSKIVSSKFIINNYPSQNLYPTFSLFINKNYIIFF